MEKNMFDRIAGYREEKKELEDLCYLLKNREELKAMGGKLPRGVFLIGPNGVGKSVLAGAFIHESQCPCVSFDTNDIADDNEFTEYVKGKFREAAEKAPCILFIDEIDKIAGNRDNGFMSESFDRSRILLNEINHYGETEGLFLLFAGNNVNRLDYSIVRPGRVDRIIHIDYPTEQERQEIITHYTRGRKFDSSFSAAELAAVFSGFSGADIESVLNNAVIRAFSDRRKKVTHKDIMEAYYDRLFRASGKSRIQDDRSRKMLAYHEAGHAAMSLLYGEELSYATIVSRGNAEGFVHRHRHENQGQTCRECVRFIDIALSGYLSEDLFLGENSVGCGSDLGRAWQIAQDLVTSYGYDGIEFTDGSDEDHSFPFASSPVTAKKAAAQEEAEEELLKEATDRTGKFLHEHQDLVRRLAEALMEKDVLYREELEDIYKDYSATRDREREYGKVKKRIAFLKSVSVNHLMEIFHFGKDTAESYIASLQKEKLISGTEEAGSFRVVSTD